MTDFLATVAARAAGTTPVLLPRRPSRFEPMTWHGGLPRVFELDIEARPEEPGTGGAARGPGVPHAVSSSAAAESFLPETRTPDVAALDVAAPEPAIPWPPAAEPAAASSSDRGGRSGPSVLPAAPAPRSAGPEPVPATAAARGEDEWISRGGQHPGPGIARPWLNGEDLERVPETRSSNIGPAFSPVEQPTPEALIPPGPRTRLGSDPAAPQANRTDPSAAPVPTPSSLSLAPVPRTSGARSRRDDAVVPPAVHVTIGRVEVRAPAAARAAHSTPRPAPNPSVMPLEQYLNRRRAGA